MLFHLTPSIIKQIGQNMAESVGNRGVDKYSECVEVMTQTAGISSGVGDHTNSYPMKSFMQTACFFF